MRSARLVAVALLLALGFTWGILRLLNNQFSAGDFYPEYSSLRSDPKGAKLLFDSLSRLPGLAVTRNYLPIEYLPGQTAVLFLALNLGSLDHDSLQQIESLARRGDRLVIAMASVDEEPPANQTGSSKEKSPLEKEWKVRLVIDRSPSPAHHQSFSAPSDWTVQERTGSQILAIERPFDKGSVLLLAESGDFNNESTIAADRLDRVSQAIGSYQKVAFDESHFGIAESGSVMQLMRRFRLMGLAFGLVIVGALVLWKNTSAFPPPTVSRGPEQYTGRTSFEGLVTLLERHVRPKDVIPACWNEWLKANRREVPPQRAAQAARIAAGAAQRPIEAMREIDAALSRPSAGHPKGAL